MDRANNFDGLRLIGALTVIVGHAYVLTGRAALDPMVLGHPLQTVGVIIFFSVSGFLITASWTRRSNPLTYLVARFLRIFPALVVLCALTVFVLGPLTTALSSQEYWDAPRTMSFFDNVLMKPQFDLPGVFGEVPFGGAVNGSLWTLPAEFFCYLAVPVVLLVPGRLRLVTMSAFLVFSLYYAQMPNIESPVVWGNIVSDAADMWVFFAAGALLRLAYEWRRDLFRVDVAVVLMTGYVLLIEVRPESVPWVGWVAIPYAVLTIGLARTPVLRRAGRFGDFSYGVYLYAFPVQQLVIRQWGVLPLSANLALVVGISLACGAASWYVVEHPALRLKDWITRRFDRRAAAGPTAAPAHPTVEEPVPDRG